MLFRRFFVVLLVGLSPVVVADRDSDATSAVLLVRGEAQVMAPPDQVSMVLWVTTELSNVKRAMAENAKNMHAMLNGLMLLGLSEGEYQTQHFRVEPVWSQRPKQAGSQWKSHIIAYRIHNSVKVVTQRIDLLGDIIEVATTSGVNQVNTMHFSLSNLRKYRERAITLAMHNAKADAISLARASGDTIKRTLSLQLDDAAESVIRADAHQLSPLSRLESFASTDIKPPIRLGDITVSASVSVTYELSDPE